MRRNISEGLMGFMDWVRMNKVTAIIMGMLTAIFVGVLLVSILNSGTNNEGNLRYDQQVTETLDQRKEDNYQQVQQDVGITVSLPSREEVVAAVEAQFPVGQELFNVNSEDVYNFINRTFGEDVEMLARVGALPNMEVSASEQASLNLRILEIINESQFIKAPTAYTVYSGLDGQAARVNVMNYIDTSEDRPVIADLVQPVSISPDGISLYMNADIVIMTGDNYNYINPAVLYNDATGGYDFSVKISPRKQSSVNELAQELESVPILVNGNRVEAGLEYVYETSLLYEDGRDETERAMFREMLIHPVQLVSLTIPMETLDTSRTYIDLQIHDKQTILQEGRVGQTVPVR